MIRSSFLVSVMSIFMALEMSASTVHWITFIDTEDEHVGMLNKNAHSVLYSHFINVVNNEVSQFGYDHKVYDFSSSSYSSENCVKVICDLQCNATDVIVFYYIGHGYRGSSDFQKSKYPYCTFGYQVEKSIPFTWIHDELKKKGAQLVVSIGDCSNAPMEFVSAPSTKDVVFLPAKGIEGTNTTIAEAFLRNKGDIIVCSASPRQQSIGGPTNFGNMDFFTYTFVSCFEIMLSEKKFNWDSFLKEVSTTTAELTKGSPFNKTQTPTYDYNLRPIQIPKVE